MGAIIAHADMDAFYAAIEQLDDPRLRGRPLLVGLEQRARRRTDGELRSAAVRAPAVPCRCRMRGACVRDALIVPPRFERYQQVSKIVMEAFGDFSPHVEPLSLDEAFLE